MGCSRRRRVCGRGMPLPYMPSGNDRPNGIATAARANVGRDALIPPGPAAAGMFPVLNFNGAAGVNARPTDPGKHGGHPGNATPAAIANPCRGRCSHRPGVFAAARGSAGGINPAPTGKFLFQANRAAAMFAPVCRGGPRPSRGGTRHGRAGRYGIGPYMGCLRRRGVCGRGMPLPTAPGTTGQPGKCRGRGHRRADALSARFTAAHGSAGGINPAPTNKFYVLGHQNAPDNTPP